ncbi:MAG: alpha/beta hydrolase, partial [Nocardioidaceae bacterium]
MPSPQHQVLTWVIPVIRRRTEVHDPEQVRHDVLAAQADADPAPPRRVARAFDVRRREAFGMPVFELRPRGGEPRRTVLYLHGGGFVSGLDRLHWRYAARLVRDLGVRVVLPSYPLAPTHTWRDALPRLVELFDELAGEVDGPSAEGVVLVGDSAGGGLAVSLAQLTTGQSTGPRPTHLVVFAPWLDLTGRT